MKLSVKMIIVMTIKWYCDQKHFSNEILGLNFEKKTVYLNYNFPIQWSAIITPERILRRHASHALWLIYCYVPYGLVTVLLYM